MKLIERRREADAAVAALYVREREWRERTVAFRAWCERHRAALIVGGGFGSGVMASFVPVGAFMRFGSMLTGTLSLLLNSPLTAFFAGQASVADAEKD